MVPPSDNVPDRPTSLRKRTLTACIADTNLSNEFVAPSLEQVQRLMQDLQLHQIELETQNEELRSAQLALASERSHYHALYDLAPVAYCTVNEKGLIAQANLTMSSLVGVARSALLHQAFIRFVGMHDQPQYCQHRKQVLDEAKTQTCELRIHKSDGTLVDVHLLTAVAFEENGAPLQRLVLIDLTERNRLHQAQTQVKLAQSLVQAQERSKQRFSRELHDRTSANLAALHINLNTLQSTDPSSRNAGFFNDCMDDTIALLADTNSSIRDMCSELHPPTFDLGGLPDVLESYARRFAKRTGLRVSVQCQDGSLRLARDLELALFRIVQEALSNCAKHAQALSVAVQLATSPLRLSISDDGVGFDPDLAGSTGLVECQGLRNMQASVEYLGGKFRLTSELGGGTRIDIDLDA